MKDVWVCYSRFNVNDELAFPLLLRGLSHSSTWTQLTFSKMIGDSQSSEVIQLQVDFILVLVSLQPVLDGFD